jgi:hypothetical protein
MNKLIDEPKKTKQQLKRSAINSLWFALVIAVFPKCSGLAANLEGYYKPHPKKHQTEKLKLQATSLFNTYNVCGKTYYREDCVDSICQDCRSIHLPRLSVDTFAKPQPMHGP